MIIYKTFLILLLISCSKARPKPKISTCGYDSCHQPKEGFINVHLIPHTHDDVGWLKTFDQYYWGSRNDIQNAGVQYILDSVINSLEEDPSRRFIYVETSFFWKWWLNQDDTVQAIVKDLVNNGQLEFIGGAWSMNDEAATNYQSTIDQFTWGLRKLNDTFGECGRPKIGWQIDPFGHSREMASIFAQLGYDGLFLGRIDYQDKDQRNFDKTMEVIWRGSASLGKASEIFTGVLYSGYGPPPGFCFDILCNDDPINDDEHSPDYNVDEKVDAFLEHMDKYLEVYDSSNLIVTMGSDFYYQNANKWFKNMDKLIHYANERQSQGSKYNLMYSTPSCYLKAVYDETKGEKTWVIKEDDFFPYASDPHAYWTGYFTSRPTSKRFEREGNNFLQVCKQLSVLANLNSTNTADLDTMREAMGVMQHHDSITGTEKQHVAFDYARILQEGFDDCQTLASSALNKLTETKGFSTSTRDDTKFHSCLLTNISSCPFSETENDFVVTVYNPLSRTVNKFVRLPVLGSAYKVKDIDDKDLKVQLIPIPEAVQKIPGRDSEAIAEIVFRAENLPPLGFKSYYISRTSGNNVLTPSAFKNEYKTDSVSIKLGTNGLVQEVTANGITIPTNQNFYYYKGFIGDNQEFEDRSSGAYIFRPLENSLTEIADKATSQVYQDEISLEIHQTFNEWVSQIIRIYNAENYIEFDWLVGPIPTEGEENGKEIITRFETDLDSQGAFYTDSNGREMLQRIRNFRSTWNLKLEEPESGNYYPVTSKITLKDFSNDVQVSILNDRAQGGSSLQDGSIELMIHRVCLHDDDFGVGEALIEDAYETGLVARGSHYMIIGPSSNNTKAQERKLAQEKLLKPWIFLSKQINNDFFTGINRALPENVQILTLEPWKDSQLLLRLEHVFEVSDDEELSKPVLINLADLFYTFTITSIEETTLGANQWLKDNNRLVFYDDEPSPIQNVENDLEIILEPMQIRTFIIGFQRIA